MKFYHDESLLNIKRIVLVFYMYLSYFSELAAMSPEMAKNALLKELLAKNSKAKAAAASGLGTPQSDHSEVRTNKVLGILLYKW